MCVCTSVLILYVMKNYYQEIRNNEAEFKKLTGLKISEFDGLHSNFEHLWTNYFENFTLEGKARLRQSSIRKNSIFSSTRDALLFGLIYLKCNLLQDELASRFEIDQPKASRYLYLIRNLLRQAINSNKPMLPRQKQEWLRNELYS
jgi:Helix-turn-helix of DDE superfamily endonuclease